LVRRGVLLVWVVEMGERKLEGSEELRRKRGECFAMAAGLLLEWVSVTCITRVLIGRAC